MLYGAGSCTGTILLCVGCWYQRKLHIAETNAMALGQHQHQTVSRAYDPNGPPTPASGSRQSRNQSGRSGSRRSQRQRHDNRDRPSNYIHFLGWRRLIQEKLEPSGLPTTLGALLLACFLLYLFFRGSPHSGNSVHKVYIVKKAPTFVED